MAQIGGAVNEVIGRRLEDVYLAIEAVREEFQQTVTVMDGNDRAVIAELQRFQQLTPIQVMEEAAASWERFVKTEAEHLGLKVIVPKVATTEVEG